MMFATLAEAEQELRDFIADSLEAVADGDLADFDHAQYRVARCGKRDSITTLKASTNIAVPHHEAFNALTSGKYSNFALFSCFVNGEPTSAIVAVTPDGAGGFDIAPLFVSITPGMALTDHDGNQPAKREGGS
jgi:hypothetical protein